MRRYSSIALSALAIGVFLSACNSLLGQDRPDLAPDEAGITPDDAGFKDEPDGYEATRPIDDATFADSNRAEAAPMDSGCMLPLADDDAKNCGACGHDCLGGVCVGGSCRPVKIADGGVHPMRLVADQDPNGWLYWLTYADPSAGGGVQRLSKVQKGALPDRIWFDTGNAALARPYDLALSGSDLCWTFGCGSCGVDLWEAFVDCAFTDGTHVRQVATNPAPNVPGSFYTPWPIGTDAVSVFFATRWEHGLWRAPRDGTSPVQRIGMSASLPDAGSFELLDIAIDQGNDGRIYWLAGSYLFSSMKDGSDARVFYAPSDPGESLEGPLLVDAQSVFWFQANSTGTSSLRKQSKTLDGGAGCPDVGSCAQVVAQTPNVGDPANVIDDGLYVVWINAASSTLVRAKKDGSEVTRLASGLASPSGLAADSSAFYWSIGDDNIPGSVNGSVWKLAR